jgi:hypothetical protein
VGSRTAAARAEVVAAREGLAAEAERLEAAGRAAVDIPARIRREPAKVAGAASGAAFLLLGGPGRVIRGARRLVFGPQADLPKSMLPDEVEKTLKKLGKDGDKVRGTLEREFADYLEEKAPQRRERDLGAATAGIMASLLRPFAVRAGKQLAERLLDPDDQTFADALDRVRGRMSGSPGSAADTSSANGSASPTGATSAGGATSPAGARPPGPSARSAGDGGR